MSLLLGIDLGQTSTKLIALRPDGTVAATASAGYPVHYAGAHGVEQEPDDWVRAVGTACAELCTAIDPAEIRAIGLSSAAHHGVLLDESQRPVRRAILLTDGRSQPQARELESLAGQEILERSRNAVSASWTLAHLRWIGAHEPEALARARKLVFAKDYVRLALTGVLATDRIEAEGSMLYAARTGDWDPELVRLAGIGAELLPPIHEPSEVVAELSARGAEITGLPRGIPVVAGASDTAAEAFAAGAVHPGDAVIKLATAGNVNVMTEHPRPSRNWLTYSHPVPGLAYHCQATNSAATALGWWQQRCGLPFAELLAEAEQSVPGAGGVLFHPYLLGERSPVWDADVRASFTGIGAASTRGDLTRAVLEGVALSLAECLQGYRAEGVRVPSAVIIGGGARNPLWRQIVSDVLGLPLRYPALADSSAGAAMLAGIGTGVLPAPAGGLAELPPLDEHIPDEAATAGYRRLLGLYTEIRTRLADVRTRLAEIKYQ
ncbi:xylulokinase [Sciscionella sediminilitoris]|uniref:xylulokinase n=1 Tax=Sciscionella sediminilitoris TaxID=1445613 RepID=UPI00068E5320|nr:FGGY family carbohydrate kinase [Sciscionella sp. SE31]